MWVFRVGTAEGKGEVVRSNQAGVTCWNDASHGQQLLQKTP